MTRRSPRLVARTVLTAAIAPIALSLSLSAAAAAPAPDRPIQMKDLPPVVRQAVTAATAGATLRGLAKEEERGAVFYEAETMVNGHTRDLLFGADGRLVSVEEEVALDAVPAAVRTAFTAKGKVTRVEKITKDDKVTYEAAVERQGKKSELQVDGDGKLVKP